MWPNAYPEDLVTFTEEMINGKHHFLYSEMFAKCTSQITNPHEKIYNAWKMSVFGVILVRIFPHSH